MEIKFAPGFQDSWDRMFHWKYAPLRWYKWVLNIPREIKWLYQRARRGYAEEDTWSLDGYLSSWLPEALRELKERNIGYPAGLTDKKWKETLEKMAEGFEAHRKICEIYKFNEGIYRTEDDSGYKLWKKEVRDPLEKQFDEGMKLFVKYYFNLWD